MTEAAPLHALIGAAAAAFEAAGLDAPRREARALAAAVLDLTPEAMVARPDAPVSATGRSRFTEAVRRRAAGEPLARITGRREFWSLDLVLGPETLVPRPETETVVEAALEAVADRTAPLTVLDLGTGTGCLLLALLVELPHARGVGVDHAAGAVAVARENARRLGLAARARFRRGDWGRGLAGPFDLVVVNPPYIPDGDRETLPTEVAAFDPPGALFAGADGLAAYRALAPDLARLLAPGGTAVLELGAGQASAVAAILGESGLSTTAVRPDLAGRPRALSAVSDGLTQGESGAKKKVGKEGVPV